MKRHSRKIGIILMVSLMSIFGLLSYSVGQVAQCTDDGCTPFQLECEASGGVAVCVNSNSDLESTKKDVHRCEVALAIMKKNCVKDNPQPCIVAEDRVVDRCYYLPLTLCVEPQEATELFQNHPDMCFGPCDDIQGCNDI